MFLKNFNALLLASSRAGHNSGGSKTIGLVSLSGVKIFPSFRMWSNEYDDNNTKLFNGVIYLGDSNIKATYDQYNLQGNRIILDSTTTKTFYALDEDGTSEIFYIISGTPTADAIIREIGLVKDIYNSGVVVGSAMLYREVLATPVALTANTAVDLMFKIKLLIA